MTKRPKIEVIKEEIVLDKEADKLLEPEDERYLKKAFRKELRVSWLKHGSMEDRQALDE